MTPEERYPTYDWAAIDAVKDADQEAEDELDDFEDDMRDLMDDARDDLDEDGINDEDFKAKMKQFEEQMKMKKQQLKKRMKQRLRKLQKKLLKKHKKTLAKMQKKHQKKLDDMKKVKPDPVIVKPIIVKPVVVKPVVEKPVQPIKPVKPVKPVRPVKPIIHKPPHDVTVYDDHLSGDVTANGQSFTSYGDYNNWKIDAPKGSNKMHMHEVSNHGDFSITQIGLQNLQAHTPVAAQIYLI